MSRECACRHRSWQCSPLPPKYMIIRLSEYFWAGFLRLVVWALEDPSPYLTHWQAYLVGQLACNGEGSWPGPGFGMLEKSWHNGATLFKWVGRVSRLT